MRTRRKNPLSPRAAGGEGRGEGGARRQRVSVELVETARSARQRAYAPYSEFKVGAAVAASGAVHAGANIENASYGLTICAERAAIASAVVAGARRVDAVAVASGTSPPTPPCGMCLQTLAEFGGPDLPVALVGTRGERVDTTLGELLPHAFGKKFL
ncbi:MAG TPA: cytidine deaminase [Anaeromyxobacteraceae bacterium]|nr:cytidine deaminase [Anaeromyxobacteraceae bacterium]